MNIREQPEVSQRNQQITRVTNQFYRQLIRRCLRQNPEERPSMADIIVEMKDLELEQKKRFQTKQELETSLATERHARQETEKELQNIRQHLVVQTQAREETERRLHDSKQRSLETEKELRRIKQQACKLQTSLDEQNRVIDETEKTVNSVLQHSQELTEEARWYEQRSHELETHLGAEKQAKEETEKNLNYILQQSQASMIKVKQAREDLKTALAEQQKAHEKTKRDLYNSERRSNEQAASLTVERQDKIGPKAALAKVQEAHEEARMYQMTSELENRTLPTTQQDFEEHSSSRDTSCDWILQRSEITLSDTVIREGKWGRVVVGGFRDRNVAVKEVHLHILPLLDRSFFEREMKMAFECRHDCLLQFIGATNDEQSPLFVTELLETSLRAVLRERALAPIEIKTIALDVAEGLNYLHQKRPDPIIHRDISSANVLLWRKGGDWRAKVSNCITDNFLQQSMAADVNYTAPEIRISYTPKVDVYSFGVLFWEMNIRSLPADLSQINNEIDILPRRCKWLIEDCLWASPNVRSSMEEIIDKIKHLD